MLELQCRHPAWLCDYQQYVKNLVLCGRYPCRAEEEQEVAKPVEPAVVYVCPRCRAPLWQNNVWVNVCVLCGQKIRWEGGN